VSVFLLVGVGWRKLGNRDSAPGDLNGLAFRGSLEQLIEVSFGVERTYGFHACIISQGKLVDQLVGSHRSRKETGPLPKIAASDQALFDQMTELYRHWVANQSWLNVRIPGGISLHYGVGATD